MENFNKYIKLGYNRNPYIIEKILLKQKYDICEINIVMKFYKNIVKICNNAYNDKWDIIMDYDHMSKLSIKLILHFDKVKLTNEKGANHTIYNLFIKFDFTFDFVNNKLKIYKQGFRTTLSDIEYKHKYIHSHISENKYTYENSYFCDVYEKYIVKINSLSSICFGKTYINSAYHMIHLTKLTEIEDKKDFEVFKSYLSLLLVSIKNFVVTESLKGIPHIHMSSLIGGFNQDIITYYDFRRALYKESIDIKSIFELFTKKYLKITLHNSVINIKLRKEYILEIYEIIKNSSLHDDIKKYLICYKDKNKYYKYFIHENIDEFANNYNKNHGHKVFIHRNIMYNLKLYKSKIHIEKELNLELINIILDEFAMALTINTINKNKNKIKIK